WDSVTAMSVTAWSAVMMAVGTAAGVPSATVTTCGVFPRRLLTCGSSSPGRRPATRANRSTEIPALAPALKDHAQTGSTPSPVGGACSGWSNMIRQMRQQHHDCAFRVVRLADYSARRAVSKNIATILTRFDMRDVIAVRVSRTGAKAQRGMAGVW